MVSQLKKIAGTLPFIIAITTISLVIFCSWYLYRIPSDGMDWSPVTGLVKAVHTPGPAAGRIEAGDFILTIDGIPVSQSPIIYSRKGPGESISLRIERGERNLDYELTLSKPTYSELVNLFAPLAVALSFWLIGIIVIAFAPNAISTNLFFGLCMFGSGILASGSVSARGPEWTSRLFNILLWWIGPLAVHLHLHFPEQRSSFVRRTLHVILYLIAAIGSLPFILLGSTRIQASSLNRVLYAAGRFNLAINLSIVVVLLIFSYIHATRGGTRRQIRIITFFGGLSLLIVTTLTIMPGALIMKPLVPYETGLLFLLIVPLSYGYSIIRYRLIKFEKFLNRGAVYVLVFTLLIGLYVIIVALMNTFLPYSIHNNIALSLGIILLLAMSFEPLRKRLQQFMDWVFYGGWYDYRSATANITEGFGQYTDSNHLAEVITKRLKRTLRLEYAYLLRISSQGYLFLIPGTEEVPKEILIDGTGEDPPAIPTTGILTQFLLKHHQVLEVKELIRNIKDEAVTEEELRLLGNLTGTWIAPVLGNELLLGILVLGPKIGREVFSSEDFDILILVSRHAGIALLNIQLLNELRHRASEIDQLHQEIVRAREEERKRLSLELHDKIIQALIGLNFNLGQLNSNEVPKLRGEVRQIVSDLRQLCSELRPPTLDNLGLVPAIRSLLRELETTNNHAPEIHLSVEGDEELQIPEDVALNAYRVVNESLSNIFRHAEAQKVEIKLNLHSDKVSLEVKDDGCGFAVPNPLGKLLSEQHFGLVGIRERLEHLQGNLSIESVPGEGTHIVASIPFEAPRRNPDDNERMPYE
jgi:two-component system sensor histidine kinase ComP